METVVFLGIFWGVLGIFASSAIACLMNGLYSFEAFRHYMLQESFFFGIERGRIWLLSGGLIGAIVSFFVHLDRWRELRENDPTYIQWKRSRELRKQNPSYNDKRPTYNRTMPSVFNAVMQLLGCIIGTYMSYKTGEPLAFAMFYVPFALAGLILKNF